MNDLWILLLLNIIPILWLIALHIYCGIKTKYIPSFWSLGWRPKKTLEKIEFNKNLEKNPNYKEEYKNKQFKISLYYGFFALFILICYLIMIFYRN